MKLITMVICALVIALFTTSCSKDNDIPDAEKNAIQALNNIVGNYKGNLAATYGTTTTIWPGINWTVDKNSTITVNNFPYQLLANGVSKNNCIFAIYYSHKRETKIAEIVYYDDTTTR